VESKTIGLWIKKLWSGSFGNITFGLQLRWSSILRSFDERHGSRPWTSINHKTPHTYISCLTHGRDGTPSFGPVNHLVNDSYCVVNIRLYLPQPPIQWLPGALFLWVKQLGSEADHSPPSST